MLCLHDYYVDRLALAKGRNAVLVPSGEDEINSTVESVMIRSQATPSSERPTTPIGVIDPEQVASRPSEDDDREIVADEWCLEYLSAPYMSSVAEAFDDDGSGFIRIAEVNEFCSKIPEGWTLLQW